jgi:limonene-1,2-epoxide hydrolase
MIENTEQLALDAVSGFLASLGTLDIEAAMTFVRPGAFYSETTHRSGGDSRTIRDFLSWFGETVGAFDAQIHEQTVFGSVVVNERTDRWTIDGAGLTVPTIGIFVTDAGLILSWFETTSQDLAGAATPEPPWPLAATDAAPATPSAAIPTTAPIEDDTANTCTPELEDAPPDMSYVSWAHTSVPALEEPATPEPPAPLAASDAEPAAAPVADDTTSAQAPEPEDASPVESSDLVAAPIDEAAYADHIAELETQVHDWRRRALIWRERTIAAQTLNDSLRANIDDLRKLARALESNASAVAAQGQLDVAHGEFDAGGPTDIGTNSSDARPAPNWKRFLSKDYWKRLT